MNGLVHTHTHTHTHTKIHTHTHTQISIFIDLQNNRYAFEYLLYNINIIRKV